MCSCFDEKVTCSTISERSQDIWDGLDECEISQPEILSQSTPVCYLSYCACVCVYIYIYIYTTHTHIYIYIYIYIYTTHHTHTHIYNIHTHTHHTHTPIYILYIIYIHIYIYYTHTHTHTHTHHQHNTHTHIYIIYTHTHTYIYIFHHGSVGIFLLLCKAACVVFQIWACSWIRGSSSTTAHAGESLVSRHSSSITVSHRISCSRRGASAR